MGRTVSPESIDAETESERRPDDVADRCGRLAAGHPPNETGPAAASTRHGKFAEASPPNEIEPRTLMRRENGVKAIDLFIGPEPSDEKREIPGQLNFPCKGKQNIKSIGISKLHQPTDWLV